jgi:hypothetical protein
VKWPPAWNPISWELTVDKISVWDVNIEAEEEPLLHLLPNNG